MSNVMGHNIVCTICSCSKICENSYCCSDTNHYEKCPDCLGTDEAAIILAIKMDNINECINETNTILKQILEELKCMILLINTKNS